MPRLSRLQRLVYGLVTAGGLLVIAELLARGAWGQPPEPELLARVARCTLQEEAGRSFMTCGRTEGGADVPAKGARPRVVVLGGSSVNDPFKADPHDNFPEHLGARLAEVEVVNLGVAGMSVAGVSWLLSQIDPLKPDLVVIYEGHNDYAQTLFQGRITGTRLWMVDANRLLARSWIFALLARREQGVDLWRNKAATPSATGGPTPPAVCFSFTPSERRGTIPVTDDIALRIRDDLTARYRDDLVTAVAESPAPVVLSTLLRNPEYPPSGSLVTDRPYCAAALPCLGHPAVTDHGALVDFAKAACGEEASITAWVESRAAAEAGDKAGAEAAFDRSLALDAAPLRAPREADTIIREVAADRGTALVDLGQVIGPMPPAELFTDTLHPSSLGAARIAEALEPIVREKLGIAAR